jgi:hypothetical protein
MWLTLVSQVTNLVQQVRILKARRDFFTKLSTQPAQFIRTWLESQSRDLEVSKHYHVVALMHLSLCRRSYLETNEPRTKWVRQLESVMWTSRDESSSWKTGYEPYLCCKPIHIADKWVKVHEAVSVHEGTRVANAVAQFNQAQAASYQANMRHA